MLIHVWQNQNRLSLPMKRTLTEHPPLPIWKRTVIPNQSLSGVPHLSQTFLYLRKLQRILPHGSALYVWMLSGQTQNGLYLPVTRLKSLRRKHCALQYLLG
uniref:Uncharacterized protein n=1 Tax=Arundo donax TaxID=35708 RepID=A0A0A9CE81_ARUDO